MQIILCTIDILFIVACSIFDCVGENIICVGYISYALAKMLSVVAIFLSTSIGENIICVGVIISPDESRGYIGFRSVAPPPPP